MVPFRPLFRNSHWQTIAGHLWKRSGEEARFPVERRFYRTEPEVEVAVESQHPAGTAAGNIVMVHGLEGDGRAGYMRGMAGTALRAGFAAHRFHMRTCGGTERLCRTLYHAGLSSDLLRVLEEFREEGRAPVFLVGFSLGGNVALKLAGAPDKAQVLAIGDGPETDIKGAVANGLACVFISGGINTAPGAEAEVRAKYPTALILKSMPELAWD